MTSYLRVCAHRKSYSRFKRKPHQRIEWRCKQLEASFGRFRQQRRREQPVGFQKRPGPAAGPQRCFLFGQRHQLAGISKPKIVGLLSPKYRFDSQSCPVGQGRREAIGRLLQMHTGSDPQGNFRLDGLFPNERSRLPFHRHLQHFRHVGLLRPIRLHH